MEDSYCGDKGPIVGLGAFEDFTDYQTEAAKTAIYPDPGGLNGFLYTALGLAGEAGEYANKAKKILRDNGGALTPDAKRELGKEIGGVLWYCAMAARELGLPLHKIARENIEVLASRAKRGVI